MKENIGNLEEMILLVLMSMKDEAYGVSIRDSYIAQSNHNISLSAVHTVLRRLEKKGFIISSMGGATEERGGRRKRLYEVTRYGFTTLERLHEQRLRLWNNIPPMELE